MEVLERQLILLFINWIPALIWPGAPGSAFGTWSTLDLTYKIMRSEIL
jgi:hypothetical protein